MPNREGEPWHDGFGPLDESAPRSSHCYRDSVEQLKAECSAWQSDDCPVELRADAAERIAKAFPDLAKALEESVKLQTHYAELLNMHDGGERIGFESADAWIDRLRECGTLSR